MFSHHPLLVQDRSSRPSSALIHQPCAPRRSGSCRVLLLLALPFYSGGAPCLASESQGWLNNSVGVKTGAAWKLKVTQELRGRELTHEDRFLKNGSLGFFRDLPKSSYLGLSYKRQIEERAEFETTENRMTLEAGWKRGLSSGFTFDSRFRSEFRTFESDLGEDHLRLRLRFRLRKPVTLAALRLEHFVSTELFSSSHQEPIVNRSRFSLGTAIELSRKARVVVNYLRQDSNGKAPIHILNTGLELSF